MHRSYESAFCTTQVLLHVLKCTRRTVLCSDSHKSSLFDHFRKVQGSGQLEPDRNALEHVTGICGECASGYMNQTIVAAAFADAYATNPGGAAHAKHASISQPNDCRCSHDGAYHTTITHWIHT